MSRSKRKVNDSARSTKVSPIASIASTVQEPASLIESEAEKRRPSRDNVPARIVSPDGRETPQPPGFVDDDRNSAAELERELVPHQPRQSSKWLSGEDRSRSPAIMLPPERPSIVAFIPGSPQLGTSSNLTKSPSMRAIQCVAVPNLSLDGPEPSTLRSPSRRFSTPCGVEASPG